MIAFQSEAAAALPPWEQDRSIRQIDCQGTVLEQRLHLLLKENGGSQRGQVKRTQPDRADHV